MLAYKFRLYPNEEEERKVRSDRPELTFVDRRPLQPSANELQVAWMKQEAPPARAG